MLIAFLLAAGFGARAQPTDDLDLVKLMELKTQVVTASKVATNLDDAPAVIEVITAADFRRRGFRTVAEALQWLTGFYVVDDHVFPNVSVRGVSSGLMSESGLIKVMVDGQPVSFRSTGGNWLGVELLPLSAIARVEIVRGPASALYGADAFLGVVNIITVEGRDFDQIAASVGAGVVATDKLRPEVLYDLAAGTRVGRFDVLVGVAGENGDRAGMRLPTSSPDPLIPSYATASSPSGSLERFSLSAFAKVGTTAFDGRLKLKSSLAYQRVERGGDFTHWSQLTAGVDGEGRAVGTRISLDQLRVTLAGEYTFSSVATLRFNAAGFQGGPLADDHVDVASDFYWVKRQFGFRGFNVGAEMLLTPRSDLQVLAGGEFTFDEEQPWLGQHIDKVTGKAFDPVSTGRQLLLNTAAFVQADWRGLGRLAAVTGGLRLDLHNIYGQQFSGRVGVVSHWLPQFTTKLLYGNAFKAPSPLLLFGQPLRPGDIIGNPALKPQRVHTVEWQASATPSRWLELTSAVAWSLILDKAEFAPVGINVSAENVSRQNVLSWETQISIKAKEWLKGYASFDLQYGVREVGTVGYRAELIGTANVGYPLWVVRAGVSVRLFSLPVWGNVDAMLVAPRRASDSNIFLNGGSYELPSYVMLNLGLQSDEFDLAGLGRSRVALNVYNALNSSAADPGFAGVDIPRLPVEVMLRLSHAY